MFDKKTKSCDSITILLNTYFNEYSNLGPQKYKKKRLYFI